MCVEHIPLKKGGKGDFRWHLDRRERSLDVSWAMHLEITKQGGRGELSAWTPLREDPRV